MAGSTILVVEDNPISMKLMRVALGGAGYRVLEARDGRTALDLARGDPAPDLILQDLKLPDMDGIDLALELRKVPGADAVPILAISGFLSKMESACIAGGRFTDYLFKPVEPSQLLSVVEAYLRPAAAANPRPATAPRVLVADDDPVQRKLTKMHLTQAGYDVTTAADGREALEKVRRLAPTAVVSDVLMPRLDGFRLCLELKREPALAGIPVILTSSSFTDAADQDLAAKVGAEALVTRSPDPHEMLQVLGEILTRRRASHPVQPVEEPVEMYASRIAVQLERQALLVTRLASRLAKLQVEVAILSVASEAIRANEPMGSVLERVLQICLNACGFSRGAVHLAAGDRGLTLAAQFGHADGAAACLSDFFGHEDLLLDALSRGRVMMVPGSGAPVELAERLLERAGVVSIAMRAITFGEQRLGVFWMGSDRQIPGADAIPFAEAIATQFAQAIMLCRAFARAAEGTSEHREGSGERAGDHGASVFLQDGRPRRAPGDDPGDANARAREGRRGR